MSLDGQYTLETPENVAISFELAGPGSRFCAWLIDALILFLIVFVLFIASLLAGVGWGHLFRGTESSEENGLFTWISAFFIVTIMLILFGYYLFFELLMRGQTPGKRQLKLRVIRDDGTPAMAMDIVIRNLVRIVDFLPSFYVVGGLVALISPTHKRLGDMAAGTLVVKEAQVDYRAHADRKQIPVPVDVRMTNAALTAEEQILIRGFLERRSELLPEARRAIAERVAARLLEKNGGHFDDAESYLERLAEGRHFEH